VKASVEETPAPAAEEACQDAPEDGFAAVKEKIDALDGKIETLTSDIAKLGSIMSDRMMSHEILAQFDKTMKGELSDVKSSSIRSLLVKIANVRENAATLAEKMRVNKENVTADDAIDAIDNIGDMLEEILLVNGAVRFRDETGTPYEYPKHNKAKLVDTDDPALNKTVAEVVNSGYVLDDRILLPEKVNVYRFVAPPEKERGRSG
jgi:molecular chaperone GrpE (heat shock protein)